MELTLTELKSRLAAKYDEVTLLEILDIKAEDLVELAEDLILEKRDELLKGLEEDGEFNPQEWQEEDR